MTKESWNADTIVKKSTPPAQTTVPAKKAKASAVKPTGMTHTVIRSPGRLIVQMAYSKDTPGTYVFAAVDPDAPITTLYVRKTGMPGGAPKEIEVIVR